MVTHQICHDIYIRCRATAQDQALHRCGRGGRVRSHLAGVDAAWEPGRRCRGAACSGGHLAVPAGRIPGRVDKSVFLVLYLLMASFVIYAQKGKLNYIDENGLQQGYWKVSLPDKNGHYTILYEGLFYNGKQVGVWKCLKNTGLVYSKEIFSDTLGEQFDMVNYYRDEKVESQGHMILKLRHDSVQIYDRVTDSVKWDTVKLVRLKSGPWKFFWENGILKETGEYYNDKKRNMVFL